MEGGDEQGEGSGSREGRSRDTGQGERGGPDTSEGVKQRWGGGASHPPPL